MRQNEEKRHKVVAKHNRSAQNGAKTAQLAPITAPERPKTPQNAPKTPQNNPKLFVKCTETYKHMSKRREDDPKRMRQAGVMRMRL